MKTIDQKAESEALALMRERGDEWYAYRNEDLGSRDLGHLQFLQVGPERTFKAPPARMPDTARSIGWRYVLVGPVNMETGEVSRMES